jgi:hypothetical protein
MGSISRSTLCLVKKFLISILMVTALSVYASESPKPVEVEADGEAYMSEIDTPKEVIERAKREAEKKAIEKAIGVFIRSHTLVSNSQLAEDLVYATVRGRIQKSEVIKEGWDEKDRNLYKVKLKALVEPLYPERGEGLSLKLSLSKSELKEADEVKIFYQADRPCYVYIFSIAEDGSVTLLFPNSLYKDNYVEPGRAYEFPPKDSPLKLKAMFLPGFKGKVAQERIKIIATKKREELLPLGFQEGIFKVYDASSTGMISDLVKRLNQIEPSEWAEAQVLYRIER